VPLHPGELRRARSGCASSHGSAQMEFDVRRRRRRISDQVRTFADDRYPAVH